MIISAYFLRDLGLSDVLHSLSEVIIHQYCVSPEDNHTELIQILDYWVQFRLKISLRLCCGVNFVKKYR